MQPHNNIGKMNKAETGIGTTNAKGIQIFKGK